MKPKIIIITLPIFVPGEADKIVGFLRTGMAHMVHIRKPEATEAEVEALICQIPAEYRDRLVLHDHHPLAMQYGLYGVHLNGRNPQPPVGWKGSVSRSCHSLQEVVEWKNCCNYLSLSPIFDSISKLGYSSAFSRQDIVQAHQQGIIDDKVLALGGVTFAKIDEIQEMGFGGAMILGDAWK